MAGGGPRRWEPASWIAVGALTVAAVAIDPFPRLRGPAPYPPEWQWLRREALPPGPILPALITLALVLLLVVSSDSAWARRRARLAAGLVVSGAVLLGFAFQLALLRLEPDGAFASVLGQTAYRTATSYYTAAISAEARDPLDLLRRYHELLPAMRKSAKHASTHPPGPILFFRGLLAAFEASPASARTALGAAHLDQVNARQSQPERALVTRATALVGGLLIAVFGAATAWPIALLARQAGADRLGAARLAVLWAVVPGPALMTPMLDQALALPVAGATAALATAALANDRRRAFGWAMAAGALGGLALWFSYGAPVFLAFGGLAALALVPPARRSAARAAGLALAAGLVTAVCFFAPALFGYHPIASARTALAIHREFFTAPRSYRLWLLFDPLDLAVFLGLPLFTAWAWRTVRSASTHEPRAPIDRMRLATAAGLLAIVLAGVTRGEVGRIWIPLMPPLLVSALGRTDGPTRGEALAMSGGLAAVSLAMALWWRVP